MQVPDAARRWWGPLGALQFPARLGSPLAGRAVAEGWRRHWRFWRCCRHRWRCCRWRWRRPGGRQAWFAGGPFGAGTVPGCRPRSATGCFAARGAHAHALQWWFRTDMQLAHPAGRRRLGQLRGAHQPLGACAADASATALPHFLLLPDRVGRGYTCPRAALRGAGTDGVACCREVSGELVGQRALGPRRAPALRGRRPAASAAADEGRDHLAARGPETRGRRVRAGSAAGPLPGATSPGQRLGSGARRFGRGALPKLGVHGQGPLDQKPVPVAEPAQGGELLSRPPARAHPRCHRWRPTTLRVGHRRCASGRRRLPAHHQLEPPRCGRAGRGAEVAALRQRRGGMLPMFLLECGQRSLCHC
mmetsp:Transcript_1755/g.6915  ORF Transcript_1755/g.6915 Transcript_1755/m.6915 type:complete len:362 (-) Transcript_1755:18-1103(-)